MRILLTTLSQVFCEIILKLLSKVSFIQTGISGRIHKPNRLSCIIYGLKPLYPLFKTSKSEPSFVLNSGRCFVITCIDVGDFQLKHSGKCYTRKH